MVQTRDIRMEAGHTVESFTQELPRLSAMTREMGELLESRLERTVQALAGRGPQSFASARRSAAAIRSTPGR